MIPALLSRLHTKENLTLGGVPKGFDALVLAKLAKELHATGKASSPELVIVCQDDKAMAALSENLAFFAPFLEKLEFPAWDCLPYDRASPHASLVAKRMLTLSRLARVEARATPCVLLTTVNAIVQRVPSKKLLAKQALSAAAGNSLKMEGLTNWLESNGFIRASTVRETGEYAVRGGLVDLFPAGLDNPVRLDFFGEKLESIRAFDAETQRTSGTLKRLDLVPTSEVQITVDSIARFRTGYLEKFGGQTLNDMLYEAISQGRRISGYEHFAPLFHAQMDTLFDYLNNTPLVFMGETQDALAARFATIQDYYEARVQARERDAKTAQYKPLLPQALYIDADEWMEWLSLTQHITLTPFAAPDALDLGGRKGRSFSAERMGEPTALYDALKAHLKTNKAKRIVLATQTPSARERLHHILVDQGVMGIRQANSWGEAENFKKGEIALTIFPLQEGFETQDTLFICDNDILGESHNRQNKSRKKANDFISEATSLMAGDIVVHIDHGIGRFIGLKTLTTNNALVDCLEIHYANETKLFLPVQNIELLSRYGNEDTEVQLDKLGGVAWQARKAKLKQRIREMAAQLMKIAAARLTKSAPTLVPEPASFSEFISKFRYDETEDQQFAIDSVLEDLAKGKPMDRLVCGDVGFGKTEVALRAAHVAALGGKQVAVVVPTTLLARQHYANFKERFAGLPVRVEHASRLVSTKELNATKEALASGQVDIIVGTHALLSKSIEFKDLGLVIIDEEQRFGVGHKERLKELRHEVHVLTLTATPIPRTLQLAMTGVRDLSIIATPPVDRLAVRTFVTPFDPVVVKEALLRERYRGGQAFFVCPRIEDLSEAETFLREFVPEVKYIIAHGQMPARELENKIDAFYEGKVDVLLSTTIVESGLDIPRANTLIIYRADRFGLAQLYQLRGRVGRSKTRAYALFTVPINKRLTPQAEKRLKVLQSLDTLGAGFQLASHDLDIRGGGNLLGEEQSGHIKEVGFELYQSMLEEAVTMLKAGVADLVADEWSPQITLGVPVLIPETYVADLGLRLQLYRDLGNLTLDEEIDTFAASLMDRFGKLPPEVVALLKVAIIKNLCRAANIEKVDSGPKGAVITFRDNRFANPQGLMAMLAKAPSEIKIRPDQKIVFMKDWNKAMERLNGTAALLKELARIAGAV